MCGTQDWGSGGEGGAISLKPVGYVRTRHSEEEVRESFDGVDGKVEVLEDFSEGLEGLDGFSHIIVVAYLDRAHELGRGTLKVKPKWLVEYAEDPRKVPEVGVFATRSPRRPNPIALSFVRLRRREGRILEVDGLDLYDGTPVLDIKPYIPVGGGEDVRFPPWFLEMQAKVRRAKGKELTF